MKLQDVAFLAIFILLVLRRNPKLMIICGITSLLVSIPLFSFWIFFTAERLTWYAATFFLLAIIFGIRKQL